MGWSAESPASTTGRYSPCLHAEPSCRQCRQYRPDKRPNCYSLKKSQSLKKSWRWRERPHWQRRSTPLATAPICLIFPYIPQFYCYVYSLNIFGGGKKLSLLGPARFNLCQQQKAGVHHFHGDTGLPPCFKDTDTYS